MLTANTTSMSSTNYADAVELSYRWTICDSSFIFKDTNKRLKSSPFKSSDTTWNWYCYIWPNTDGSSKLGLGLKPSNTYPRIPTVFGFSLITLEGEVNLAGPSFVIFEKANFEYAFSIKIKEYEVDPGETLTIVCRIRAMLSKETSVDTLPIPACKMQDGLANDCTPFRGSPFRGIPFGGMPHSAETHFAEFQ